MPALVRWSTGANISLGYVWVIWLCKPQQKARCSGCFREVCLCGKFHSNFTYALCFPVASNAVRVARVVVLVAKRENWWVLKEVSRGPGSNFLCSKCIRGPTQEWVRNRYLYGQFYFVFASSMFYETEGEWCVVMQHSEVLDITSFRLLETRLYMHARCTGCHFFPCNLLRWNGGKRSSVC